MSSYQFLTLGFYALLASFAIIATWRHEGKRQVGAMLFGCWVASNVIFWTMPITFRPSIFPILDVLFALSCAKAGKETGSRVPLVLISLSVLAVSANAAFSISGAVNWSQIHTYEVVLNIIFALQCLITGGWGMADVVGRSLRLRFGARRLWGTPQSLGYSSEDKAP